MLLTLLTYLLPWFPGSLVPLFSSVATRQARLEALRALRVEKSRASFLMVESSRAPKLRQTRSEMRGLMTAIRASPDESLVDLVPRRMRFVE